MKSTLIDAGPPIALLDKDDKYHRKVRGFLSHTDTALITTWPVITETCHMLDFSADAQPDFLEYRDFEIYRRADEKSLENILLK